MSFLFPLASSSWGNEEINALQEVIAGGNFTMGSRTLDFEKYFSEYIGSKYSVMVNSGSSANLLMIASLFYSSNKSHKLKPGDEVIVPSVGWSTSYSPLQQYNLKLKFVDINLETLNFDLEQLETAITEKTKAILAINILGNPNDFKSINQLIDGKDILLIEDNCESLGAKIDYKMAGTFGLMGTFSTFFSHHMSTMEGGIIVTDDEEIYQILLSLRAHGWTRNLPKDNLVCSAKSDDSFKESFRFVLPGYNVRPMELSAAAGIQQLKKLPKFINNRRVNAEKFKEVLGESKNILIQKEFGESSWFGFSLIVKPESDINRDQLLIKLNNFGFETRPIVSGNFVKNEVMKYFDFEIFGNLKNAEYIDDHGLFIGNHHTIMDPSAFTFLQSI